MAEKTVIKPDKDIYDREVRNMIRSLKEGTVYYRAFIIFIEQGKNEGKISFSEFGIKEEDLGEFRKKGAETSAKIWLDHMRKGIFLPKELISFFIEEAEISGRPLSYFGTSKEELEELKTIKNKFEDSNN